MFGRYAISLRPGPNRMNRNTEPFGKVLRAPR
jgi:hypothetical protein